MRPLQSIRRLWVFGFLFLSTLSVMGQVQVTFGPETTSLSVGETGGWTVVISNPDATDVTDATLVVTVPDDFTITNTGGGTEVVGPPRTLTWTGVAVAANGGTASFSFEARPDCSAGSGQQMIADVNSGVATDNSSSITVLYPLLSTELLDDTGSSVTSASVGDGVTWILTIENGGTGSMVTGADTVFTLGAAFTFDGISSPSGHNLPAGLTPGTAVSWNTGEIPSGSAAVYEIVGTVAGCNLDDLVNNVTVDWSDGDTNCNTVQFTGSTSIELQIREPDIDIAVNNPGQIPYCSGASTSITVDNNGTGPANSFTLQVQGWPASWAVSNVTNGVIWDAATNTFSLPDITAGGSLTFVFDIDPAAGCSVTDSATLLFLPNYTNECGATYGTEYFNPVVGPRNWTMEAPVSPTVTVNKSGPTAVQVGDSGLTYTVDVTYSGPTDVLPFTANIVDDYPDATQIGLTSGFSVVDGDGGIDNGDTISWTHTFTSSPETVSYTVILDAPVDECAAFGTYTNAVTVDTVPDDCRGCPGVIENDALSIFMPDTDGPIMQSSGISFVSDQPVDVCTDATFTTTYTFDSGAPANWDDMVLNNEITPAGFSFVSIDSIFVDGADMTAALGGTFPLSLEPLTAQQSSGRVGAPSDGATIEVTYTYYVGNSEGNYSVHSWLTIPGTGSECGTSPQFDVASGFTVEGSAMTVTCGGTPALLNVCEERTFTITIGGNGRTNYDTTVTLDTRGNYNYLGSAAFSGILDASGNPLTSFEPTDNGDGTWTWNLAAATPDASGDIQPAGTISFLMQHNCATSPTDWGAQGLYNNRCEDGTDPQVRSTTDSDAPNLILDGGPTFRLNPVSVFAYSPDVSDRIEIVNGGSGPLYNVDVTITLDADIEYAGTYSPAGGSAGPDSVTGSTGDQTVVFHWDRIDPGQAEYLDMDLHLIGCADLDIGGELVWGCDAGGCDVRNASAVVLLPRSELLVAYHDGDTIDPCDARDAAFRVDVDNNGKVDAFNVKVVELLPPGVTLVSGTSIYTHTDGYGLLTGVPSVSTTLTGGRQEIVWDFSSVLPVNGEGQRALRPGSLLRVDFDVEVANCTAADAFLSSNRRADAYAEYDPPCNAGGGGNTASATQSVTSVPVNPNVAVTKQARNITKGTGWTDNEVDADNGDVVEWQVTFASNGDYVAADVTVSDTIPANTAIVSGSFSSTCAITETDFFGSGAYLGDMSSGTSCSVTYQTTVTGCTSGVTANSALAEWGCCPATGAAENNTDTVDLRTQPLFSGGQVDVSSSGWTTCGGTVTITLTNTGGTAYTTSIVDTLPAGYTYDPSGSCAVQAFDTPPGVSHAGFVCTPAVAGNVLTWDSSNIDFVAPGETITITFQVMPDGTYCDTTASNDGSDVDVPIPNLTNSVDYDYSDSCSGTFGTSAGDIIDPAQPDLDISITPNQQIVESGGTASWTITLVNEGDAPAGNITLTDVLGGGFSSPTDNQGGTWTGNSGSWTIPGPIAASGSWSVTVQATVGIGSLSNDATVEGQCLDVGGTPTCTYTYDEAEAFTAGFSMSKTVDQPAYNVGELVTWRVRADFLNTDWFRGVTVTDNLPAHMTFVSASADVADTLGVIIPAVTGDHTTGQTLTWTPTDFQGYQVFNVVITARIDNDAAITGSSDLTNTLDTAFGVDFDGDGSSETTFDPAAVNATTNVNEPILGIGKSISPDSGLEAGDTVTVTLTVSNTGDGPAYQVRVGDLLNDTDNDGDVDASDVVVYDTATVTPVTTPADFTYALVGSGSTAEVTYTGNGDLAVEAGGTRQFTFTVTLADTVVTGSTYTNEATVSGWSLMPSDTESANTDYNRQTTATGTDDIATVGASVSAKTITATSESFTTGTNLAVGEVATYQIRFQLPAGTTNDVRLYDRMFNLSGTPWGEYVTGSATLQRTNALLTSTVNPGGINGMAVNTPTGVDADIAVTDDTNYRHVQVNLGDVTNTSGDPAEYILTLDVVVMNNSVTNASAALTDRGRLQYTRADGTNRNVYTPNLTQYVAEPAPTLTKSASTGSGQGDDQITFTVVIRNAATGTYAAPAFDWTFSDPLPSDYVNPNLTNVDSSNAPGALVSASFTGNTLSGTIDQLDPDEYVTLTYTADIRNDVQFGTTITNTVDFETTSLPGTRGTGDVTPGDSGEANGERNGDGGVNDLVGSDDATVTTNIPGIEKDVVTPQSWYAVGDVETYQLTLSVPAGDTDDFRVVDQLPAGLTYMSGTQSVSLPSGFTAVNNPPTFTWDSGAGTLTWDFGDIHKDAPADSIVVTYDVQIQNVIGNQDGTALPNTATLYYGTGPSTDTDNDSITVGEPNLYMEKTPQTTAAGLDAGDTLRYRVEFWNNGHTTAYRTVWSDVLPDGLYQIQNAALTIVTAGVYRSGTTTAVGTSDLSVSSNVHTDDTISLPVFDMVAGAHFYIEFDVVLMDTVIAGERLTNTTRASYDSQLSGTDGRDNSTDPGNVDDDDDTDLNNYEESASHFFDVDATINIVKTLPGGDDHFTIGESFAYNLRTWIIEGISPGVVLTDVLPAGIVYQSHSISTPVVGNPDFGNPTYNTRLGTGQTVSFDFGDVTNTSDNDTTNDWFDTELTVQAANVSANQNGDTRDNTATVSWDAGSDVTSGIVTVTLTEPELTIDKSVSPTSQSLGDVVTFTVTVSHDTGSTDDAYDVVVTDVLPAGLTYVDCTLPPADVSVSGQDLQFTKSSITRGIPDNGSWSFTYRVRIDLDAAVGQLLTNNADVVWTSTSGATGAADSGRTGDDCPSGLNDYCNSDNASVTPNTNAVIDAQKTVALSVDGGDVGVVNPGDTLTYTITLTNTGTDVTGVVFIDTIPVNTTYVASSLTSSVGGEDDSADPNLLVTIGDLASGAPVTISFDVTVDAGTPDGTIISNQGSVDSDQTVPEPTDEDGNDGNGDQPTDIPVGDTANDASLYAWKFVEWLVDGDGSSDVTAGDTLRYRIVVENTGETDLTSVTLTDVIPAGLTAVPASEAITGPGNSVSLAGANLSATIPSLPEGTSVTVTFDVTIDVWIAPPATQLYVNQGVVTSDETDPQPTDGNGNPEDGFQPTEIGAVSSGGSGAPALDVEKRWSLAVDMDGDGLVDPGDTIGYTLTLTNTGTSNATNVRLDDTIPINTTIVSGSVSSGRGAILSEDPVSVNIGTVSPGEVVTLMFRVTVNGGTPDGTIIANQATATGDGGISEPSDDNGTDSDGQNPTLTPVDTGSGEGSPGGLNKSRTATSESGSTGDRVLIGEVVTFRITFDVPAGELNQVTLNDTLPPGLTYVSGYTRLSHVFDTGLNSSMNPGGINGSASGVFVGLTDGSDVLISGQTLTVMLGDIINSDNDANAEQYILELRCVVANEAGNQAGTTLTNQGSLTYWNGLSQEQILTPVTEAVTVIEPAVQLAKSADPAAILTLGGNVYYTVTVTNPSGTYVGTAYDLRISDSLPAEIVSMSVQSITPSGGVSGVTDNSIGTDLDITVDVFPPDGQLTIVYLGATDSPLAPGSFMNTAIAEWTSLPGPNGTGGGTPGGSGDADGERNGAGGVNDYSTSDSATVAVGEVDLSKIVVDPQTRYAIGDIVDYQITISVPAGLTVDNTVFTDILDEGLTYVTGSLSSSVSPLISLGSTPSEFTRMDNDPVAGQETLSLSWGTMTNGGATSHTILLTYSVLVDNILINQNNQTLDNAAAITFDDPGGSGRVSESDARIVTVGEPHLSTLKSITSPVTNLDAGDSISFQVDVSNDGTTTAFEVILSDVLPAGLENVTNLQVVSATGGAEIPTLTNNGTDWTTSGFDIPVGGAVRITFDAVLADSVIPGQQVQNTVTATFTSRDGSDVNERDGSTSGSDQDDDSDLDNYNDGDGSPVVTVADPVQIDKQFYPDPTNTTYTIGETFQYRLTIAVLEGTVNDLVVVDNLPPDIAFISATVGVGNISMTTEYGGTPGQSGQTLTFDLGDVTNPANAGTADDFITIDITAQVLDETGHVDGTIFGNNAYLSFTGPSGTITRNYDADAGTAGVQPLDGTIIEPDVIISKTADPTIVPPGDVVTFTILLDHSVASTSDAYDLTIVDTLPAGLTYVSGSASIPVVVSGQQLTFNLASLTLLDDNTSFTFQATVDNDVTFGGTLTNTASLTYTSMPGVVTEERTYSDSDTADVTANETTVIDAVKSVTLVVDGNGDGLVQPGDTLEYEVVLTNTGSPATNVVFTDTIPIETTYISGSLTASTGTPDDSGDPDLLVTIPSLPDGGSTTLTFRVTVNSGTPEGTVISNQGHVDSEQTVPEPTDEDGNDGNGDQPTDITVGGEPAIADPLYVQKTVVLLVDADTSGDVTAGDTMRYTILIRNLGDGDLTDVGFYDTIPTGLTYVAASATISGSGNSVNVAGNVVTADIPVLAGRSVETVTFDVTVDNWTSPPTTRNYVNQGQADSNETDAVLSDSNGDPSDGSQPTQFVAVSSGGSGVPILDVEKRAALENDVDFDGLVDPGDSIRYTITINNYGAADAVNVWITDATPAFTTAITGTATTSQGVVVGEDPLDVNIGDIAPGGVVTISFHVLIDMGTPDGTIVPNQATASGDNFSDTDSDDNGDDGDGINPTLVPVSTGSTGAGSPTELSKSVIGTTLTDTPGSQVAIGETVTFRISVNMPEGTVRQVTLHDTLPVGMSYVSGSAELARVFDTGMTGSANPAAVNSAASGVFVALADGSDITVSGQNLSVFLGDVINSDDDSGAESYLLTFDAIVDNVITNQQGDNLLNQAGLRYYNGFSYSELAPVVAGVTVIEPNLQLTKAITGSALCVEGGTTVSYSLTVHNTATTATAFSVDLRDVLPPELLGAPDGNGAGPYFLNVILSNPDNVTVHATGLPLETADMVQVTTNTAGDTLTWPLFDLPPGAGITITYDTVVSFSAVSGVFAENIAVAAYEGTATGIDRNGSDGGDDDDDSTLNNYVDGAFTSIEIAREFIVDVQHNEGGSTNVTGPIQICNGDDVVIIPTPDPGYHIGAVYDNGVDVFCNICSCWCDNDCRYGHIIRSVLGDHLIEVVFVQDENPVIERFEASRYHVVSGSWVTMTVESYDPDGGNIVWYEWDVNGDGQVDRKTYSGTERFYFGAAGEYPVTVNVMDDDCNHTISGELIVSVSEPQPIVLPSPADFSGAGLDDVTVGSWIVNPYGDTATVQLTALSRLTGIVGETSLEIPGFGKAEIDESIFGDLEYDAIKAIGNHRLVSFVDMNGAGRGMSSWLPTPPVQELYAPHIAEERDMWDTFTFLSNPTRTRVDITVDGETHVPEIEYSNLFRMDDMLAQDPVVDTAWARFLARTETPFTRTHVLTGFEMFIRNNGDGAATELAGYGHRDMLIPHIPTETDIFWTGLALFNPGDEATDITIEFFSDAGELVGVYDLLLGARTKTKGLMADLFPEVDGTAGWARVDAELPVIGLEIYGTWQDGICGFGLNADRQERMILPLLMNDEELWTGFAVVNPTGTVATAIVELRAQDGSERATRQVMIEPGNRYKAVVADFFNGMTIAPTDYLVIRSDQSLSGVAVSGDMSRSFLKAIAGIE